MFAGGRPSDAFGGYARPVPPYAGYTLMFAIYLFFAARISFTPGTMIARLAGILLIATFLEFMIYVVVERG
jgi:hypothetical protein